MARFRDVDPGDLYLPSARQDGPDPWRYQLQVSQFGSRTSGMPPILVTEDKAGRFRINNGVTRAVRIHKLAPGTVVSVEVIDVRPNADFSHLKRVRDLTVP